MWAYSDESERGATLLFGLTVVPAHRVVEARRRLRSLLLPGQRRLHTAKESPSRTAGNSATARSDGCVRSLARFFQKAS